MQCQAKLDWEGERSFVALPFDKTLPVPVFLNQTSSEINNSAIFIHATNLKFNVDCIATFTEWRHLLSASVHAVQVI